MFQLVAPVLTNDRIAPGIYRLSLKAPSIARSAKSGQFVHLRLPGPSSLILRRPFSIHRTAGGAVKMLYKVVGPGTESLARMRRGEFLDLLGPLGTWFDSPEPGHPALLVAGGMGIAPLAFLTDALRNQKPNGKPSTPVTMLLGTARRSALFGALRLKARGVKLLFSTEDGSLGFKGLVTELLEKTLDRREANVYHTRQGSSLAGPLSGRAPTIYACGPRDMLARVAAIASGRGLRCYVSLEERMACGVGACLGCVVRVRTPRAGRMAQGPKYARVCRDGPVFDAEDIVW
jgi:dihydroorotate dehydrogenase electron transfer subunit